jgi:hypothetical protein
MQVLCWQSYDFVQLVKAFDYNVINLSEIMASADILVQIIGAVYDMYNKSYI